MIHIQTIGNKEDTSGCTDVYRLHRNYQAPTSFTVVEEGEYQKLVHILVLKKPLARRRAVIVTSLERLDLAR